LLGDENMVCPLYKDYIRECVNNYKEVLQVPTYEVCESDNFNECPMYKIIVDKIECCEYTPECDKEMNFSIWDYEHLKNIANNYCFLGKKNKCAIYKLRKANRKVLNGLQPDGKIVKI
jgi:hypothetical protein